MGYNREHTIVVSAYYGDGLDRAHARATELFGSERVSPILGKFVNGLRAFFVAPDGSKEGWNESDTNDNARAAFRDFLRGLRYEDRSSPVQWVEVQYGDDNGMTKIIDDSDSEYRAALEAETNARTQGGGR